MQYFNKTLLTLKELMRLLEIEFHYQRLFEKYETDYTIDTLLMLMARGRKMYAAVDSLTTIFKLLHKRKDMLERTQSINNFTGTTADFNYLS